MADPNDEMAVTTRDLLAKVSGFSSDGSSLSISGDLESTTATKGYILKSPNQSRWKITVDDAGVLSTSEVA